MGKGYRPGRLGEEIRKVTSDLLLRELKDPRFTKNMVSVTAVDVSSDGSYATLYLTAFGLGKNADLTQEEKDMDSIVINEAVEMCKKFAGDNDYQFVNGVLGAIAKDKEEKLL